MPVSSDAAMSYRQAHTHQLSEEARIVCLRFGADYTPECMEMDEMLYKIVDAVKDWVVIYVVDNKVLSPPLVHLCIGVIRNRVIPLPFLYPLIPDPNS